MEKILANINDIKLRKKFVILFFLCVLLPMLTTNGFILWSAKQNMDKELAQRIENIADRLEWELQSEINEQISIADYLNRNSALQKFLTQKYPSASAYYESYVGLLENQVIQYYYTAQSAYRIVIVTGNESITNGSYFIKNSEVSKSSWRQAFTESGRNSYLYSYFEDGKESGGYIQKGRCIVLMQKLDYCGKDDMILLQLDYQSLLEQMELICEDADGYLMQGEQILLSTTDKTGMDKPFLAATDYREKGCSLQRTVSLYGQDLTICLTQDRASALGLIWQNKMLIMFLYFVNLLLPSLYIYISYRSLYDRVSLTQQYLERIQNDDYAVISCSVGQDEIGDMIQSYNTMALRIKELIEVVFKNKEREQNLEISRKQAELRALMSQLNPHFIFNALESIRMHSIIRQETETAQILESFSVLMRKNIQWNQDFVAIAEECDTVRRYLEIQKYRFGERFEFFLHMQPSCGNYRIPKFTIVTFVENACVHGIEKSVNGGSVTVMVSEDENSLYFEILDAGGGMEQEALEHLKQLILQADISYIQNAAKSIGIANTVVRLRQYYGETVTIDINSTAGEGTEICIQLPKQTKAGEEYDQSLAGR